MILLIWYLVAKIYYNTDQSLYITSGQKIHVFKYCTHPEGQVTCNFHSSCKHMHLSFKSVYNKEHKGVICNMTSLSYSFKRTPSALLLQDECFGKKYSSFLDFTRNYKWTSGIFVP